MFTYQSLIDDMRRLEREFLPWVPWGRDHPCMLHLTTYAKPDGPAFVVASEVTPGGYMVVMHPDLRQTLHTALASCPGYDGSETRMAVILAYYATHRDVIR